MPAFFGNAFFSSFAGFLLRTMIRLRPVQFSKALSSMLLTAAGSSISLSEEQP